MFGFELHGWETMLIVSALVAAAAAIGVGLATYAVITLTREENSANSEALERYKADAALRTADATRGAAQANERAAELERQASELKKEAESAKAEAAKANERILEMKRMRRLEKPQAEALRDVFASSDFQTEPKVALRVGAVADAEAQMFAMEFQNLFASCGVNIYPTQGGAPNEVLQLAPTETGLIMSVKDPTKPHSAFAIVHRVLHAVGLPCGVDEDHSLGETEGMLVVMRKPG
ncbi:hypothetical protein [Dyella sp. Tek66A03]|uniref:hypothetical protein n=1 Tax=Dyella sp. Tek66A03 TaxID=3458298 RepID=UPI00403E7788